MRRYFLTYEKLAMAAMISLILAGCASARHVVPQDLAAKAVVAGMPDVRSFEDESQSAVEKSLIESVSEESPCDYPLDKDGIKIYPILAISGGAANGAYGAGLLKGCSQEGSRPKFKVVTGVSTGALIAPFAFLGPEYDLQLERLYTNISTKDIIRV